MKPLRTFFMEDWLESNRFSSKYNLGESGGRPRTVKELLVHSGLCAQNAFNQFMDTILCDSPNRGRSDLRKIIAGFHPGATEDNVLVTTGTSEALFLLFRHLEPKSVALAMPAFQLLYELPLALGAKIIPLPVRWNEKGTPFVDEHEWLQILRHKKPSCLLFNHPHNPSGLVFGKNFLEALHQVAQAENITLIGDEHYRFLSGESTFPFLGDTLYKNDGRTFVTGSFIKCLGAPGLRIGWCVGPKKDLDALQNEKNYTTHTVNPISEWISYEVLQNLESPLFENMRLEAKQNKILLQRHLDQSSFLYGSIPQGGLVTCIGFLNCFSLEKSKKLHEKMMKKGIFTLPLQAMEFGSYQFEQKYAADPALYTGINQGYGFRLGLGCAPEKLDCVLKELLEIFATRT